MVYCLYCTSIVFARVIGEHRLRNNGHGAPRIMAVPAMAPSIPLSIGGVEVRPEWHRGKVQDETVMTPVSPNILVPETAVNDRIAKIPLPIFDSFDLLGTRLRPIVTTKSCSAVVQSHVKGRARD